MRNILALPLAYRVLLGAFLLLTSACQRAYYPLQTAGGYTPAAQRPDTATLASPAAPPVAAEATVPPAASALPLAARSPERPRRPRLRLLGRAAPVATRAVAGRLPAAVRSASRRSPALSRPFLGWSGDAWSVFGTAVATVLALGFGGALIVGGGLLAVVGGVLLLGLGVFFGVLALYVFAYIK